MLLLLQLLPSYTRNFHHHRCNRHYPPNSRVVSGYHWFIEAAKHSCQQRQVCEFQPITYAVAHSFIHDPRQVYWLLLNFNRYPGIVADEWSAVAHCPCPSELVAYWVSVMQSAWMAGSVINGSHGTVDKKRSHPIANNVQRYQLRI